MDLGEKNLESWRWRIIAGEKKIEKSHLLEKRERKEKTQDSI